METAVGMSRTRRDFEGDLEAPIVAKVIAVPTDSFLTSLDRCFGRKVRMYVPLGKRHAQVENGDILEFLQM